MASSQNSISSVFSVFGMWPKQQRPVVSQAPKQQQRPVVSQAPGHVSLFLVVRDRRRVLFRDIPGTLRVVSDEIAREPRLVHAPTFDELDLYRPDAVGAILCDALGASIDEDGLYGLGSELLNCALATGSRNLCAEVEVVHNTVVVEDVELDTCSICLEDLSSAGSVTRTQCSHRFHLNCLVPWLEMKDSYSCPLCRTEL